ncbi:MAG: SDR family oxidoreductase [Opitutales bacterium]
MKDERRTIVITGATRGLGRAMTLEMARRGHRVVGCGRNAEALQALRQVPGPAQAFTSVDVTDPTAVTAWAEDVVERFGAPDLLINNAGVINDHAPSWELRAEVYRHLLEVNVLGIVNVLNAFVQPMLARGTGMIVNLSSGAGRKGYPNIAPYCVSKFAVEGLTQSLAAELPDGLGAIALAPGVINTEMLQAHYGGEKAAENESPEDWARHAVPYILALTAEQSGQALRVAQKAD